MAQSTRVARLAGLEIHLKKKLEVTSAVAADVPQLPNDDPWVIVQFNTNTGTWQLAGTFNDFETADQAFVNRTTNQGLNADRLGVGKQTGPRGRVIES